MGRKRSGLPLSGWLVIDKDPGLSSAKVVAAVLRITGAAKAGHGGTLDPLATGVLPIALGEATKAVTFALNGNKTYRFTVRWGQATATDDGEGDVIATATTRPTRVEILAALPLFTGLITQRPPIYSAIKVAGERAYDLARRGEAPEMKSRDVHIQSFVLVDCPDPDHAVFEIACGKGTYVRSLARDLGEKLGCFGHVSALRRTSAGKFTENQAISLDKLEALWQGAPPLETLLPIETALDDIPALALTGPQADRLRSGQSVRVLQTGDGLVCAMNGGRPVALAQVADGEIRPVRVFNL